MLVVKVNKKNYNIHGYQMDGDGIVSDWSEITLDKAIELKKLIDKEAPKKLLDHYKAIADNKDGKEIKLDLLEREQIKDFPIFYGRVLEVLSNIPRDIIAKIQWSQRETFYNLYLEYFVFYLLYTDYSVKAYDNDYFSFNSIRYYLPKEQEALGTMIPAYETTMVEFAQASDVILAMKELEGGNIEALKTLVAIYCRPKKEKYDELKALERAKEFGELDMKVALGVFFYIYKSVMQYMNHTLISLGEVEALKLAKHSKNQDWKRLAGELQSMK